jgi:hypothetical protein
MHGATCSELLSAWAVVDVAGHIISKIAAREGAIISLRRRVLRPKIRRGLPEIRGQPAEILERQRALLGGLRPKEEPFMTNERISPDPYRPGFDKDYRDPPQRLEEDLQIDPEHPEGRASGSKMVLFKADALHTAPCNTPNA